MDDIILSLTYMQVPDENGRTRGTQLQWCASMCNTDGNSWWQPVADLSQDILKTYQSRLIADLSVINVRFIH